MTTKSKKNFSRERRKIMYSYICLEPSLITIFVYERERDRFNRAHDGASVTPGRARESIEGATAEQAERRESTPEQRPSDREHWRGLLASLLPLPELRLRRTR